MSPLVGCWLRLRDLVETRRVVFGLPLLFPKRFHRLLLKGGGQFGVVALWSLFVLLQLTPASATADYGAPIAVIAVAVTIAVAVAAAVAAANVPLLLPMLLSLLLMLLSLL